MLIQNNELCCLLYSHDSPFRRPLLSEDNDVVSNYFSGKKKGYGLLSAFNKVRLEGAGEDVLCLTMNSCI